MNERDHIFGPLHKGTYMYCISCERTYKYGEHRIRVDGNLQMCPYRDCNGDAVIDAHEWETFRARCPDYPEIPERGVVYPQEYKCTKSKITNHL